MKITTLITGLALFGTLNAQTQLSKWHVNASDDISFTSSTPTLTGPIGFPLNVAYNNICDNSGNLIFSVQGQAVKNAAGTLIGMLPNMFSNSEIAIVPNPGNLIHSCQKKYYIVYPYLNNTMVGTMGYAEVDMNASSGAGSLTVINNNIGSVTMPVNPLAVSPVNSNGKRYLYFLSGSVYNVAICEISATGITPLNVSAYTAPGGIVSQCNEMELSNAGDKLAFANAGSSLVVVPINPATGLASGTASVTAVTGNVNGLEFDASGSKLFFSKTGSGAGVYVMNLSTSAITSVPSTSAYGAGMLEKTYSGSTQYIACASATGLVGFIDPSSATLNSALTLNYQLSNNTGPGYTLVLMPDQIDGENYAAPVTALVPSFTAPASICAGTSITVNGSASYGTINGNVVTSPNPITYYVWTVVESNAAGTPVTGATEWWSPWGSTTPGSYTLPSYALGGPDIQCGKYYKIKLALQNSCIVWSETSKVIYINCPPTVNAGPDVTVCSGGCFDFTQRMIMGYTYQWTGPSGVLSNSASVHVCPTITATTSVTYTYTITNTSGCSASDAVTVTYVDNDPSFSLLTNTVPTTYFTVKAYVNNTAAYSDPGFLYDLKIEEMNGSSSYYSNTGTSDWWDFPIHEFKGFTSTGTGTYIQLGGGSGTVPGVFLYGHTYKITRGTWNNSCPRQTFYEIITPVRSLITGQTTMAVIAENGSVPENTQLVEATSVEELAASFEISVYPNPNTGVFTIETSTTDKSSIEIYDVLGNKVKAFEQNGFKSTVDLSAYPKGMYMINVITDGKKVSRKIILE